METSFLEYKGGRVSEDSRNRRARGRFFWGRTEVGKRLLNYDSLGQGPGTYTVYDATFAKTTRRPTDSGGYSNEFSRDW